MTNSRTRRRRRNKNKHLHKGMKYVSCMQKGEETSVASDISDDVDRISQLPDDILISIISRLTVAEAVSTSILSTRWCHLSKYITRIDFSPTAKQLQKFEKEEEDRDKEGDSSPFRDIFVIKRIWEEELVERCASVINRTLDTHNGGAIIEEIRFYLPWFKINTWLYDSWPIESGLIERWLDFAFSKKVQTIHLHINSLHLLVPFPPCCFLAGKNGLPSFKTLKELSLMGVDVDDEALSLLLSKFVALERLSIERSGRLSDVSVVGGLLLAPKLKQLSITTCFGIKSIEIRDVINLESLRCYGLRIGCQLVLENVPRLVELYTDCYLVQL